MTNVARKRRTDNLFCQGEHTIKIPGNGVAAPGIDAIKVHLSAIWGLPHLPDDWCWDWRVGGKGEYVGTLPKRIGKFYYQEHATKLTPDQLTTVGNLGSQHSTRDETYLFDFVDQIDWKAGDFGDSGSCFWTCHASAKDMILLNGGGAVRFFDSAGGIARAWIVPWAGCLLVFNGYGMETLPIARILAAHFDHAYYQKVKLHNNGAIDGALWINGGTGYLIGPQFAVTTVDAIDLEWEEPEQYTCEHCGDQIDEDDHYHSPAGDDYCESCYGDRVSYCGACDEGAWRDDITIDPDGNAICDDCYSALVRCCEHCQSDVWESDAKKDPAGNTICNSCYDDKVAECVYCYKEMWNENAMADPNEDDCCRSCFDDLFAHCDDCGGVIHANSQCKDCRVEVTV